MPPLLSGNIIKGNKITEMINSMEYNTKSPQIVTFDEEAITCAWMSSRYILTISIEIPASTEIVIAVTVACQTDIRQAPRKSNLSKD